VKRTTGDQYQVECPACGKIIRDLWDLGAGLCAGAKIDCGHCGTEVEVEAVDTTVDVTLVVNVTGERTETRQEDA
jgi:hypothetical protein